MPIWLPVSIPVSLHLCMPTSKEGSDLTYYTVGKAYQDQHISPLHPFLSYKENEVF